MGKSIDEHTCDTCEYGEWYRHGYDVTMMDDECGGCCSWNDKWQPMEAEDGNVVVMQPTVEAILKADYKARLKADYVSKKKIAQATNKIIKCSLGEWYAGRVDGKTEEVVLMDDVLHIMQGLLNEKEQINEN